MVDCAYIGTDLHSIASKMALMVKDFNQLAYAIIWNNLDSTFQWIEDEKVICNNVPEIDIVMKN